MEEEDSSPHNSLTWSPVQRPPTDRLNMNYCLEIQVTLTDELEDTPPPLHVWTSPVVEDMLQEARVGLTEAVVIGPGRAILFYGRHSMGEGLKVDKARDAAFLLTGAGMWVGKSAYLTTNPMTLQEGKKAITQDDVLTVLDEHYKNVKALDALNQELLLMRMAKKETVLDWGVCLSRHLQILAASFPDRFSPERVAKLKRDHFYRGLPKQLKAMVAYLKVRPQVRTYLDYLRAAREAEKEDLIESSQTSRTQTTDSPSKPRMTSFFPLRKLKGSQPFPRKPVAHLAQLEEEDANNEEEPESDDPDGIKGVTEEFMVRLARAEKDTQTDERHCYHCSSPEYFIRNCPLMKTIRDKKQLNGKEGMVMAKGAWTPPKAVNTIKSPQKEAQEA